MGKTGRVSTEARVDRATVTSNLYRVTAVHRLTSGRSILPGEAPQNHPKSYPTIYSRAL